jgi:hypothetical protein
MMVVHGCRQWRELSDLAGAFRSLQAEMGLVPLNPYADPFLHKDGHMEYKTIPLLQLCFR